MSLSKNVAVTSLSYRANNNGQNNLTIIYDP